MDLEYEFKSYFVLRTQGRRHRFRTGGGGVVVQKKGPLAEGAFFKCTCFMQYRWMGAGKPDSALPTRNHHSPEG